MVPRKYTTKSDRLYKEAQKAKQSPREDLPKYKTTNTQLERIKIVDGCTLFYDGRGARIATYDPLVEGSAQATMTTLELARDGGYITPSKYNQFVRIVTKKEAKAKLSREKADSFLENTIDDLERIRKSAQDKRIA